MNIFAKVICCIFLCVGYVTSQEQQIRVGAIEFYGYKGIDVAPIRAALPIKDGATFSMAAMDDVKRQIKQAVKRVTGYEPARAPMTCCDAQGNWNVFIPLNGLNNKPIAYKPVPTGTVLMPQAALDLDRKAHAALMTAVKS